MKPWLLSALLCVVSAPGVRADQPPAPQTDTACVTADNLILGPRTQDRPLPLLSGDPARGFHPACTVPWSTLSPKGQPLTIVGCFRDSLVQFANDAACGRGTGQLWVSSRWVLTSKELTQTPKRVAACEHLETGALAATRDFDLGCDPHSKDTKSAASAAQPAPAAAAATPTPATATSSATTTAPH
jgi:hypothetical protein